MFQARIFSSHFRHNFSSTKTTLLKKMIVLRTLTRTTTTAVEQGSQFPFVIPKERVADNMAAGSISPSSMLTLEQEQLLELKANQKPTGENNKMDAVAKQVGHQYIPGLLTNFFRKIAINRNFHPQHKMILRESATKLYDSCANGSNYILLHKEFGMPDNFFSWYRLTLLHIWMGLVRMQQSMEAFSFCLFRNGPGHVHHMAVMVAPTRVDYSVNKGGIRTWVVLIVFVLLCSAILQIFSEEGGEERELTMVEDGVDAENEGGWKEEAKIGGSQKRPIISGQNNEDEEDDEEDEEDDENEEEEKDGTGKEEEGNEMDEQFEEKKSTKKMDEEEMMLARLREKAAKRWKERQQQQQQKIQQQQQEAMMNRGKIARERIRRRNAKRRIEDDDDEDEEDEEEEEQKLIQRQEVAHENADDEEDEEEQKREREEEHGILLDTEDEKDDDDRNEIAQQQHFMLKRNKIEPKTKKGGHVKSWRELRVQKDDGQKPRKELLRQQQRKLKYVADIDTKMPIEMEEDEENGEEKDEENEQISPATEIIALRKRPGYNRKAITNRGDYRFRQILDSGDYLLEKHEFDVAMQKYQQVLEHDPQSPRGLFGRARLHQLKSEFADEGEQWAKKEEWLEKAMTDYSAIMENEETPDELFRMAADHFVECARFRGGQQHKIVQVQRALLDRFPDNLDIQCQFGATWLGMNRPEEAAAIFKNVLEADPTNALGQAYYGFILKTHNGELEKGVQLLRRAIRSGHPDVRTNPKFYFHLGDGLTRLGRIQEAYSIYADAVKNGLFPSVLQRSVHNLKGLTARPWWALDQTECAKQLRQLERHWTAIKEEIVQLWNKKKHLFVRESGLDATLVDPTGGQWALVLRGNSHGAVLREEICDRWMPSTCELLKAFTNSICAREKIKLSVLGSGTSSWPHCGPTNYILEAHLGILTPSEARLRVGNEIRGWRQGKMFIFDTSFEREIIFDGAPANALRIALVLELWHPEMPQTLRGKIVEEREEEDDGK